MLGNLKYTVNAVKILAIEVQMLIANVLGSLLMDAKIGIVHDYDSFRTLEFVYSSGDLTRMGELSRPMLAIENSSMRTFYSAQRSY